MARIEAALLSVSAQFCISVAAAKRPVTAARAAVVLEYLNAVAGVAQFVGGHESCNTGAKHEDRGALRGGAQLNRSREFGFSRKAETVHRLVHRRAAGAQSNHRQQPTPRNRTPRSFAHAIPLIV